MTTPGQCPRLVLLHKLNGEIVKKRLLHAAQRIDVDDLIGGTTLNREAFRWAVVHSETTHAVEVTRLEYSRSTSHAFFQFDRYRGQHYAFYSWGGDEKEEHFAGTWSHALYHLDRWLARLPELDASV